MVCKTITIFEGVADNQFYDYRHNPYHPVCSHEGKLVSADILQHVGVLLGKNDQLDDFVRVCRRIAGDNNVVWGVKRKNSGYTFEFYFYNHGKENSRMAGDYILRELAKQYAVFVPWNPHAFRAIPYFMFSFEFSRSFFKSRTLKSIHVYGMADGSLARCGVSVCFNASGAHKANEYYFLNPGTHMAQLKTFLSDRLGVLERDAMFKKVFLADFLDCDSVCIALKKRFIGLYFSRIKLEQFQYFLRKFGYPDELNQFVRLNRKRLDHMLYDVAFDVSLHNKKIVYGKSSFYGSF